MNSLLKKLEITPISLEKIGKICPNMSTIVYDDLPKNAKLSDIFKGKQAVCVYYQMHGVTKTRVGHFTLILKIGDQIEYFSSYGFPWRECSMA